MKYVFLVKDGGVNSVEQQRWLVVGYKKFDEDMFGTPMKKKDWGTSLGTFYKKGNKMKFENVTIDKLVNYLKNKFVDSTVLMGEI